jgi:hypothetical protein
MRPMTFLRHITFEEAQDLFPNIDLDDTYPDYSNQNVPLERDEYGHEYLALLDNNDELQFVKLK